MFTAQRKPRQLVARAGSAILAAFLSFSVLSTSQTAPVPFLNVPVSPSAVNPGGPTFTITLGGSLFVANSSVSWNGSPLQTQFVSGSKLTAKVPSSLTAQAGTAQVSVSTPAPGGGLSGYANFQIQNKLAAIGFGTSTFAAGQVLSSALADFNGDHKLDLVWGEAPTGLIQVALGNGDGTFQPATAYSTGGVDLQAIVTGDFNGDGILDIAAAANVKNGGSIASIFLGNGNGTFQGAQSFGFGSTNTLPYSIIAGDFDQNGTLDLAVSDAQFKKVYIFLGNGDGTLQSPVEYAFTTAIESITAGDFNRDGKLDLAVSSCEAAQVSVMLGNGDGSFQTPTTYPYGGCISLTAADFNGDGKLDLVSSNDLSNLVFVSLGNGDGTFATAQQLTAGVTPYSIAIGDFNADGTLDVAIANVFGSDATRSGLMPGTISLLLGDGHGGFQPHVDFVTNFQPDTIAAGDLNGDGRLDLVTGEGDAISTLVEILLQNTAGLSSGSLVFPLQSVGSTSSAMPVTLTNTGSAALTVSSIVVTGTNAGDFAQTNNCPTTLAANASCTINVTFSPLLTGLRQATIDLSDSALGSPQPIALQGTGMAASITFSPASVNFGDQLVKQASPVQRVTLTNVGNADLTITSMTVSGDFLQRNPCPATIKVGGACTFAVAFQPSSIGSKVGAVTFIDSAPGSPHVVNLSGTGTLVQLTPSLLNFGTVEMGQISPPQNVTLTNTSTKALNISSITATRRDYVVTNNCGSSVAGKASCTITVSFQPVFTGIRNGTLNVGDSGGGSPQMVSLTGAGSN